MLENMIRFFIVSQKGTNFTIITHLHNKSFLNDGWKNQKESFVVLLYFPFLL